MIDNTYSIVCRGIDKSYVSAGGAIPVVKRVDLHIAPQTLTLLVGPSGCGKTTLISLLAGLLTPSAGDITALGQRLDRLSDAGRAGFRSKNVGLVVQNHNLLPALTAAENVAVPLAIAGWSKRRAVLAAAEVLAKVGLAAHCQSYPRQLSGGQQQRVAIARAIVHQPSIVLCDEPTSALDHETGRSIMQTLRQIARTAGRCVVMVTHDERTFEYADRIIRMDDGRIVEEVLRQPLRVAA